MFDLLIQTFKPKKRFDRGTLKYSLHKQANASLNSGIDLKEVVKLPPGEEINDWVAVHGKYYPLTVLGRVQPRLIVCLCLSVSPAPLKRLYLRN